CGEEDHHSHIICIKCNKVAFGCFARCECNEFKEINEEQELETKPEEDDDNGDNDPKGMNLAIESTNEVKDSTFITAEVYGKRINVLLRLWITFELNHQNVPRRNESKHRNTY